MKTVRAHVVLLAFLSAALLNPWPGQADVTNDLAGRWDGTIFVKPGESEVDITVEFTRAHDGSWSGVMSVPTQSVKRKRVEEVVFEPPGTVSWIYRDNFGVSLLTGTLSADGRTMNGKHQEQGQTYPFQLSRATPGSESPAPALSDLAGAEQLRTQFNRDAGKTRLVLILAPSCGLCYEGARLVERHVLNKLAKEDLGVYVIWTPISKHDNRQRAVDATFHVTDPRARHFWDGSAEVQRSFSTPLGLGDTPAWDVFLVYGPGKRWEGGAAPAPDTYMHRLGKALPRERTLNALHLADEVEKILR